MEAGVSCRSRRSGPGMGNRPARRCQRQQPGGGQKGIELYGVQAKLADVICIDSGIVVAVSDRKPLPGKKGEQKQEAGSVPLNRHGVLGRLCPLRSRLSASPPGHRRWCPRCHGKSRAIARRTRGRPVRSEPASSCSGNVGCHRFRNKTSLDSHLRASPTRPSKPSAQKARVNIST